METAPTGGMKQQTSSAVRESAPADGLDAFLRIARVKAITDSSKSTIWRWIRAGKFPKPIIRDGNTVLWSWSDVQKWQAAQRAKYA